MYRIKLLYEYYNASKNEIMVPSSGFAWILFTGNFNKHLIKQHFKIKPWPYEFMPTGDLPMLTCLSTREPVPGTDRLFTGTLSRWHRFPSLDANLSAGCLQILKIPSQMPAACFLLSLFRGRIFFFNGCRDADISSVTLICVDNSSAPAVRMNIHCILQSLPAVSCLNIELRLGTETGNDETLILWLLTQTVDRHRVPFYIKNLD